MHAGSELLLSDRELDFGKELADEPLLHAGGHYVLFLRHPRVQSRTFGRLANRVWEPMLPRLSKWSVDNSLRLHVMGMFNSKLRSTVEGKPLSALALIGISRYGSDAVASPERAVRAILRSRGLSAPRDVGRFYATLRKDPLKAFSTLAASESDYRPDRSVPMARR